MTASLGRIAAMVRRHVYLMRRSWPRVVEMAYWPTIQMIIWGFITLNLKGDSSFVAQASGVLVSAVLLWDVLFRGQLGFSLSFMEEMWSRNLGHIAVSPLRTWELVSAWVVTSLVRTILGVVPATLLAVPMFGVSIYDLGPALAAFFFALLVMGWAVGMGVSALVLRYGQGAESLAWLSIFLIAPISAIYYPVSVLPDWLQPVAWALPPAHVFEGMRAILFDGTVRWDLLAAAFALDLLYLALGFGAFLYAMGVARDRGLLLQQGE